MSSIYVRKANNFAKKYGIKLQVIGEPFHDYFFINDTMGRYIFKMKLSRKGKSFVFKYGQTIKNGDKVPNMYEVLSALQKYDVGSYEDFITEYDYKKNVSSKKIYLKLVKEYKNVLKLFYDIMDELGEIVYNSRNI